MRLALSVWEGRIAPVFDTSARAMIIDIDSNYRIFGREEIDLEIDPPLWKVMRLVDLEINVLICGAVSRFLANSLGSWGVSIISFITGDVEKVISSYLKGQRIDPDMVMPGCRGRRGRTYGRQIRIGGPFEADGDMSRRSRRTLNRARWGGGSFGRRSEKRRTAEGGRKRDDNFGKGQRRRNGS